MLITVGNFIRMLVRPVVTVGLGALVAERLIAKDLQGAKEAGTYFGIAMTFWFADRGQQGRPADDGDK